jgi:hypothetical protein
LILNLVNEKKQSCSIRRIGNSVTYTVNGDEEHYSLPGDQNELHQKIFGVENSEVLENLLGTYYFDQEKGWTLLNRGKAIGKISFSIEDLLRGLSDRTDETLKRKLKFLEEELKKYRHMQDTAKYQNAIQKLDGGVASESSSEKLDAQLTLLRNERVVIKNELERIKAVIRDNKKFVQYISSYHIRVKKGDVEIPVNEKTIMNFPDNMKYLSAKYKISGIKLADIEKHVAILEEKQENQKALFEVQSDTQIFDRKIMNIEIDEIAVKSSIDNLTKEIKQIKEQLDEKMKVNNPIVTSLYNYIKNFAERIEVASYLNTKENFIFTNKLVGLSGAIFHKLVFCFKMAYIKVIEEKTGCILPILLDSPSGREIDQINIGEMMKILEEDFSGHQIIIASIHKYEDLFEGSHIIPLQEKLFHETLKSEVEGEQ